MKRDGDGQLTIPRTIPHSRNTHHGHVRANSYRIHNRGRYTYIRCMCTASACRCIHTYLRTYVCTYSRSSNVAATVLRRQGRGRTKKKEVIRRFFFLCTSTVSRLVIGQPQKFVNVDERKSRAKISVSVATVNR